MACELARTCPIFNDRESGTAQVMALYRARYCTARFDECARYRVYAVMGREAVPSDLYPNDALRARRILNAARRRTKSSR